MSDIGATPQIAPTGFGRLYRGQTAVAFTRRRRVGLLISSALLVLTVVSLFGRGLTLGIDFEGGQSWDVPTADLALSDIQGVLDDLGVDTTGARLQERTGDAGRTIKVQVVDTGEVAAADVTSALAERAGVATDDVSTDLVSASWGSDITSKAIRALVIFLALVAVFISIRFEWRMAIAALVAMAHDVVVSIGVYSVLGLTITPATVIAFLTILGYSLYDTIVVFDRVRESETRFAAHRVPYADVINVSMNQVLMRSLNTSISSLLPILSLLIIGAGALGATALSEFALALLVGVLLGTYSSICVAAPLLGAIKERSGDWADRRWGAATGDALRSLVLGGQPAGRRQRPTDDERVPSGDDPDTTPDGPGRRPADASSLMGHAPRPRRRRR